MNTYKEHYQKCVEVASLKEPSNGKYKTLYDLSIDTSFLDNVLLAPSDYYKILKSLSEKMSKKLDSKTGVTRRAAADYLNEWRDIPEMSEFADLIMPHIEKDIFGCHAHIEFVMPYRSIHDGVVEASWLWHYDDCPNEFLKFVVYLNNVDEHNGCFQYIEEKDGNVAVIHSNREAPNMKGPQLYEGSRVPEEVIKQKTEEGAEIKSLTGERGTYAMLTPNIFHRATMPKDETTPRECIFFFIRPSMKKRSPYVSSDTGSILSDRDHKTYTLD